MEALITDTRLKQRDDTSSRIVEDSIGRRAAERLVAVLKTSPPRKNRLALFQKFRWATRRWSLKQIFYRMRLPVRRRRWLQDRIVATQRHFKNPNLVRTKGPAIAFGEFSGNHGLGRAAAYDVARLHEQHRSLTLVDIGDYLRGAPPKALRLEQGLENVYFLCQPDTYALVFSLISPQDIANAWRVGRWVWETPIFPEDWRFAEPLVHEVWAPSEFCAQTFRQALQVPVHVVPHAVSAPCENGIDMRRRLGIDTAACLGLAIMDIRSCPERKNPWAHVRAWQAAFGTDARYQFWIKIRVGKRTRLVLDELRELIGDAQNIHVLTEDLSNDEIVALQRAADLFISLHRSEGFGLSIYEALLLGKPVVATHWSANAEYGPTFSSYFPAPYQMKRYQDWTNHYADQTFQWAAGSVDL